MTWTTIVYALVGGILPSLIWLYFLLKEDSRCPEPRSMIALAFAVGIVAVPIALPLEHYARTLFGGSPPSLTPSVILSWALIEETLKYVMAAVFIFWRPVLNEALNYVIYLITVALGFAAAENVLYLLAPAGDGGAASVILMGDLRFIGATLLHVIASASIGFALAFSEKSGPAIRVVAGACGLILAVALHTVFNTIMISADTSSALAAIFLVWIAVVIFLATFEVLKYLQYRNLPPNTCP